VHFRWPKDATQPASLPFIRISPRLRLPSFVVTLAGYLFLSGLLHFLIDSAASTASAA
jgi:hypothetical protein